MYDYMIGGLGVALAGLVIVLQLPREILAHKLPIDLGWFIATAYLASLSSSITGLMSVIFGGVFFSIMLRFIPAKRAKRG